MIWVVSIWLILTAVILVFFYGACGPDSPEKRDQDWEGLKQYLEGRKRNA
mgnify:CR=1 FL=1